QIRRITDLRLAVFVLLVVGFVLDDAVGVRFLLLNLFRRFASCFGRCGLLARRLARAAAATPATAATTISPPLAFSTDGEHKAALGAFHLFPLCQRLGGAENLRAFRAGQFGNGHTTPLTTAQCQR